MFPVAIPVFLFPRLLDKALILAYVVTKLFIFVIKFDYEIVTIGWRIAIGDSDKLSFVCSVLGYVTNHQPVLFGATYPFVYFVMDASIHVSLMAGKMVDPLNTRIL